jgi:hypothetical protein
MQKSSRQALFLESKAELNRRKERLLMSVISLVPKWSSSESPITLQTFMENTESTALIGWCYPSDSLNLEASKFDDKNSHFNLCLNFYGKEISRHKFETTLRVRSTDAPRCYECQGIGNFAKECPARRRRRGRRQNSPGGKGNTAER